MILDIFNEIASDSGKIAKLDILKSHSDKQYTDLLKRVIEMAIGPNKYWIKIIPEYTTTNENLDLNDVLDTLTTLTERHKTGHDAINFLADRLASLSVDDAVVVERIIKKDLKIGMSEKSINKVFPKLIRETPYQGAVSFSEDKVNKLFKKYGYLLSQLKEDGMYCNATYGNSNEAFYESRQGIEKHFKIPNLDKDLSNFKNYVLNGELIILGYNRVTANGIFASIDHIEKTRENEPDNVDKEIEKLEKEYNTTLDTIISNVRYKVWDMITSEEYVQLKSNVPYTKRLEALNKKVEGLEYISVVETKIVNNINEAKEHYASILKRNLEGTILKADSAGWKHGKPVYQVKMKNEIQLDLKIVGFKYGTKGKKNENVIATLLVESSDGLLKTNPAGMDEKTMAWVTENQDNLLGTIIEMRCCGLSNNKHGEYSTLHPSVNEFRTDKTVADSFEKCLEIEKMSIELK